MWAGVGLDTRGQGGQGGDRASWKGGKVWAVERSEVTEEVVQGIGVKVRGNREWKLGRGK